MARLLQLQFQLDGMRITQRQQKLVTLDGTDSSHTETIKIFEKTSGKATLINFNYLLHSILKETTWLT